MARTLGALALVVAVSLGARAATASLRAVTVGGKERPAAVSFMVSFVGGPLEITGVRALDPSPADGTARVVIRGASAAATAKNLGVGGVALHLSRSAGGLALVLRTSGGRFKYLGYTILRRPERLAIDLWKSAPPRVAMRSGAGRCLVLGRWELAAGRATLSGRERNLFEHMFDVQVRDAGGHVIGKRSVVSRNGRWSTSVPYRVAREQQGTLEALDLSEGDRSLVCLAQVPVTLRP